MPTPTKGPRLGGGPAHQRLLLSNLATALFEHGRITTTEAKAKALRPVAEKLITFAKRGDLHARRRVLTVVRDKSVVHTLFAEIGPRFAERPGGYTRITKIGPRKGDNAPMAVIELVEGKTIAQEAVGEAERARGTRFVRRRRGAGESAAAVEAEALEATATKTEAAPAEVVEAEPVEAEAATATAEPEVAEAAPLEDETQAAGEDSQTEAASETSQAEGEDEA